MVRTSPYNTGGVGLIPGGGSKIPHASGQKKNKKQKQHCNKSNKDKKNSRFGLMAVKQWLRR